MFVKKSAFTKTEINCCQNPINLTDRILKKIQLCSTNKINLTVTEGWLHLGVTSKWHQPRYSHTFNYRCKFLISQVRKWCFKDQEINLLLLSYKVHSYNLCRFRICNLWVKTNNCLCFSFIYKYHGIFPNVFYLRDEVKCMSSFPCVWYIILFQEWK